MYEVGANDSDVNTLPIWDFASAVQHVLQIILHPLYIESVPVIPMENARTAVYYIVRQYSMLDKTFYVLSM